MIFGPKKPFDHFDSRPPWLWIFVGVIALSLLFWGLLSLGPKRMDEGRTATFVTPDDPAAKALSDEITALEERHRQQAEAGVLDAATEQLLVDAIAKQQDLLRRFQRASPDQGERLRRLEGALDSLRAQRFTAQVEVLEREAELAVTAGDEAKALAGYREALKFQGEINGSAAAPRFKNYVRQTQLAQAVERLEAAPLGREVEAAITAARAAADEKRWGDALAGFTQARDVQDRINRTYARSPAADLSAISRLEAEIATLNAGGLATDIDQQEAKGDAALAAGQPAAAAAAFAKAVEIQREINQQFTGSRFVSSERLESLEVKRQTALSGPEAAALHQLAESITMALRNRDADTASARVTEAATLLEKMTAAYPKSRLIDPALRLRLAFLNVRRADLRTLQKDAEALVVAVPALPDRTFARSETPQALFAVVMGANPSRNPGRALPVDSLSYAEAEEFCQRLSWVLGQRVRLPTEEEFRALVALGPAAGGAVAPWSKENSNNRSQPAGQSPANAAGLSDLLGNLAEFVAAPAADAAQVTVLGGSYLDPAEDLAQVLATQVARGERARHFGFRFVIESAPATR